MRRAANWVVKALVDATQISTPAWVSKAKSDSRTRVLVGTLQTVSVCSKPEHFAMRWAASVSAVSPDWLIVMNPPGDAPRGLHHVGDPMHRDASLAASPAGHHEKSLTGVATASRWRSLTMA